MNSTPISTVSWSSWRIWMRVEWSCVDIHSISMLYNHLLMIVGRGRGSMVSGQKMLNDIWAPLSNSVKHTHRISHEHWMNHILLKLLNILLLDSRFNSFIVSCHIFIFIILLILRVMGIDVLLRRHRNLISGQKHSATRDTRELTVPVIVIDILVFVKEVFDTVVEVVTKSRVLVSSSLFFWHVCDLLGWNPFVSSRTFSVQIWLFTSPVALWNSIDNKCLHLTSLAPLICCEGIILPNNFHFVFRNIIPVSIKTKSRQPWAW